MKCPNPKCKAANKDLKLNFIKSYFEDFNYRILSCSLCGTIVPTTEQIDFAGVRFVENLEDFQQSLAFFKQKHKLK